MPYGKCINVLSFIWYLKFYAFTYYIPKQGDAMSFDGIRRVSEELQWDIV